MAADANSGQTTSVKAFILDGEQFLDLWEEQKALQEARGAFSLI
jgi:hypothetical protein